MSPSVPKAEATTELAPKKALASALCGSPDNGESPRSLLFVGFLGEVSRDAQAFAGISGEACGSYEISRYIGVTQKTAWFMLHRYRLAIQIVNPEFKF